MIAIDAHVQEQYLINTPYALRCKKEYDQFQEALKVLEIMKKDCAFY
jgi:hypothetical protein